MRSYPLRIRQSNHDLPLRIGTLRNAWSRRKLESFAAVDKRLEKMEERFAKSLDDLTKTLDKFLKRLTDIEEEFIFMKEDLLLQLRPPCPLSCSDLPPRCR